MSSAEVNIPLLRKAVEWAEAEAAKPEMDCLWDQGEWMRDPEERARRLLWGTPLDDNQAAEQALAAQCGTAYCIAGYIGVTLDEGYTQTWIHPETEQGVEDFARQALGLNFQAASRLFSGGNSIADVRRIAEDIAGERL